MGSPLTDARDKEVTAPSGALDQVHETLRSQILQGALAPGEVVSQAQLARSLGVSRSPIREACRLLEREGLVEARHNYRVQVAEISVHDLEGIYASRVMLETLGVALTLPKLVATDIAEMASALDEMRASTQARDYERFAIPHDRFHSHLLADLGERISGQIQQLSDHAGRYRRMYVTQAPMAWDVVLEQDLQLLRAVQAGDFAAATDQLARHLASTALAMIALIDPHYDPVLIRGALRHVCKDQEGV